MIIAPAWYLIFSGVALGMVGDYLMKASHGFTHLWMGVLAVLFYTVNIILWGLALKTLPIGSAYTVWSGLGAVAAMLVGAIFFQEVFTVTKSLCILMVVIGSIGLITS